MRKNIEIKLEPDFPKQIDPSRDKVAFFIGAGVSRLTGCPGWDDFVNTFIDKACQEGLINHHECHSIKGIADNKIRLQAVFEKFKNSELKEVGFFNEFRAILDPPRLDSIEMKENTRVLRAIKAFANVFDRILFLTTNADILANKHFDIFPKEIIWSDSVLYDENETDILYRIHGSVEPNFEDSLVFTMQQYIERYRSEKYTKFLKSLFESVQYTFFIGYGLNEIELLKYSLPTGGGRVFWLKEYYREEQTRVNMESQAYAAMNITIIPYALDISGYKQMTTILENWYSMLKINRNIVPEYQIMVDDAIRSTDQEN